MNLAALVAQSYPSPEWAVFYEVSNTTGFSARRRADAVALGVWPSRGHALVGFEFKEDRRDWLREKENPAKAEEVAAHCDQWFVVAGKKDIVKVEELPEPWGLLVANEDRTRLLTVKACVPFADRDKSVIKRSFVASMLRKVNEKMVPRAELDRLVQEAVATALKQSSDGRRAQNAEEALAQFRATVEAFEAASGLSISRYSNGQKLGEAVRLVMGMDNELTLLRHAHRSLIRASERMHEGIEAWPTLERAESTDAGTSTNV